MTWDNRYRMLKKGETIQEGDEIDGCRDNWRDDPKWEPVPEHMIGKPASDPQYVSHSKYRRLIEAEVPVVVIDRSKVEKPWTP